jgi:cellulose synthase/poly-beta-1,6-N-acetylglucosamine synthase-like glycosyltransferase
MLAVWIAILFCVSWVGFAFVGYPLALWLLSAVSQRSIRDGEAVPEVTIVIAVHNGERHLERKLTDTVALDYPKPFEVIVASDGSTDRTEEIARDFADRGVRLVALPVRGGKEAAQARAIAEAGGEILVFTDVSAEVERGALREIVRPFADPRVGAVSSEDIVESQGGEGAYVRYEMALRRLESTATTLVGLSGSLFAIRRELGDPWPHDLASDFRIALEANRRGLRAVCAPAARARIGTVDDDPSREWTRKVRTVRRGIAVLSEYRDLLAPRRGRAAFSVWGHKLARFTAPFALVALLLLSAAAAPTSSVAAGLTLAQVAAWGLAAAALRLPVLRRLLPLRIAAFFLLVNASIVVAWFHHWTGKRAVQWQPTSR